MNPAWWLLVALLAGVVLLFLGGWIGYGAGVDHAQAQAADRAEAKTQARIDESLAMSQLLGAPATIRPRGAELWAELGEQSEPWYTERPWQVTTRQLAEAAAEPWKVPDQLGAVLPEGAPWATFPLAAPRILPWPVGPRGHNVPELAHIWAPSPERPDAEESRPVTSPADLDLSVRRMCEETARYVQQLIDQHPETP
jgi:hypothetical protein